MRRSVRTLPAVIGRKPAGQISPRWETNMMPWPSRTPKLRAVRERRISSGVRPSARMTSVATRRVGRCLGGGDHERRLLGGAVHPTHELLAVLRRERLEHRAAAHGDEEEEAPAGEPEGPQELVHRGDVRGGLGGDEGVDLEGGAELGRPADGGERAVEGALDAADRVMALRGGAVEAEAEGGDAVVRERLEDLAGEGRGGGGRDGDVDAEAAGLVDEGQEIRALERVPAREDQGGHRVPELRDLAEEREALLVRELAGMGVRHGGGAAVAAGERTGLGHLPVDVDGGARVVPGACLTVPTYAMVPTGDSGRRSRMARAWRDERKTSTVTRAS
jgi:hypothetical protein